MRLDRERVALRDGKSTLVLLLLCGCHGRCSASLLMVGHVHYPYIIVALTYGHCQGAISANLRPMLQYL